MVLESFNENHTETTYHITGSQECVLVYNPEMIVKIQPQSVEHRLNELIQQNLYDDAIKLLSVSPQKTPLIQKVQNGHLYHTAKTQPE